MHPLRSRRALRLLLAVVVVTAVVVTLGVLAVRGGDEPDDGGTAAPTEPTATPLADLDTTSLVGARTSFCEAVTAPTLESALDGTPTEATAYGDGERVQLVKGTQDVSHEYGCLWKAGRSVARAWVFAPPVTPDRARELRREARRTDGCERVPDAPDYGLRSTALVCSTNLGSEVSYRGLFGDAWLTCTLSATSATAPDDLLERTDVLCSAVAQAATT